MIKIRIQKASFNTLFWVRNAAFIIILGTLVVTVMNIGSYSRDEEKLQDVYKVVAMVPEGSRLTTTSENWKDWTLVAYFSRYGNISLDTKQMHDFMLVKKSEKSFPHKQKYKRLATPLIRYDIYQKLKIQTDK